MKVLGVVASSSIPSRTQALVSLVLEAAAEQPGVTTTQIDFAHRILQQADGRRAEKYDGDTAEVLAAIDAADAIVFGMPVYRGTYPGSLKNLLDMVPRGQYDGDAEALRAKPVAVVATGASAHHFLALDDLARILRGFFAAYVIPPGIYATHADFAEGEGTSARVQRASAQTGTALVELRRALEVSPGLASVHPMI